MRFHQLFKRGPVFTPLERRLLGELQSHLSPEAGQRLAQQLEKISLVQRHHGSREICCYPRWGGKIRHDPALNFAADAGELKLTNIMFKVPGQSQAWKAEFWVVNGHFFSIDFRPAAQPVQQTDDIEIQSVEIHHDPMQPASRDQDPTAAF
jgi:hypothetical protein